MKLRVDIPAETKISIKHKQKGGKKKRPLLPRIYGLKVDLFPLFFFLFFFFTSIWFVLDIQNVITDLEFH